jgi:squalene-associated FAD-dependent desaturase
MRIHVVGAGLAGLAAAWRLAEDGFAVTLYEAAPQAGGRCRSLFDEHLGCVIDNGGHVLLGANRAALQFLAATGGLAAMTEVAPAAIPFRDLVSGETWTLRPNAGPLPWWILSRRRRVPRTRAADYLAVRHLLAPDADATVAECIDAASRLTAALWEPLGIAVMNAPLSAAAAQPFARMLRATFGHGEAACRPWLARSGLSAAFVDPALKRLAARGGEFRPGWRLARVEATPDAVRALRFDEERIALGDDRVVLAVGPHVAADLLPRLRVPLGANAIVNAHFRLDPPARLPGDLPPLLGLIGGTAQWLIARDDLVSVTVSAADNLVDRPAGELLPVLWADVARILGRAEAPMPPGRLIKERRATFAQTPANERRRPAARTAWRNLFLAGDWTATGLPATIEGAIRSGIAAARAAANA